MIESATFNVLKSIDFADVWLLLLSGFAVIVGVWYIGKIRRHLAHRRVVADERIAIGTVVIFDNNNGIVKGVVQEISPGRILIQTGEYTYTSVAPQKFMEQFTIEIPKVQWEETETSQISTTIVSQLPAQD